MEWLALFFHLHVCLLFVLLRVKWPCQKVWAFYGQMPPLNFVPIYILRISLTSDFPWELSRFLAFINLSNFILLIFSSFITVIRTFPPYLYWFSVAELPVQFLYFIQLSLSFIFVKVMHMLHFKIWIALQESVEASFSTPNPYPTPPKLQLFSLLKDSFDIYNNFSK